MRLTLWLLNITALSLTTEQGSLSEAIASAISGDSEVGAAARIVSVSWGGYCGDRVKKNRLTLVLKPALAVN